VSLRSNLEDLERVGAADAPELLAGAAYYGTVYPVSEPAGRSFFVNLRQPQVSILQGPVG
jgi:hypothetical protein